MTAWLMQCNDFLCICDMAFPHLISNLYYMIQLKWNNMIKQLGIYNKTENPENYNKRERG